MDAINYGAIKNLDKKLGMSLGEVGSNFGMTSGQFLVNFDGFDEVNSITNVKSTSIVGVTDHNAFCVNEIFSFVHTLNDDGFLYGLSRSREAYIKVDPNTEEVSIIKDLSSLQAFVLAIHNAINSSVVAIRGDFGSGKILIIGAMSQITFSFNVIDMINATVTSKAYSVTNSGLFTTNPANIVYDSASGYIYIPYYKGAPITEVGVTKINTSDWTSTILSSSITGTSADTTYTVMDMFYDVIDNTLYMLYYETVSANKIPRIIKANFTTLVSDFKTIEIVGCTQIVDYSTTTNNQSGSAGFIGRFEGGIYLMFTRGSIIYPYVYSSVYTYRFLLRLDVASSEYYKLIPAVKEPLDRTNPNQASAAGFYITNSLTPNGRSKVRFSRTGDVLFFYYPINPSTNGVCPGLLINTAKGTLIKNLNDASYYTSNFLTSGTNIHNILIPNQNGTKPLKLICVCGSSWYSGILSNRYSNFFMYTDDSTTKWNIETTGETLMVISKIAYQGTSFLIEIDGKQITKTIPSCSSSDLKERQILLHSKTGIKLRSLDSIGIDEILWGVKANV